jgi:hypothetical protein
VRRVGARGASALEWRRRGRSVPSLARRHRLLGPLPATLRVAPGVTGGARPVALRASPGVTAVRGSRFDPPGRAPHHGERRATARVGTRLRRFAHPTMLLGEGAEPHRLSSPARAEGAREGDPVNDAGVGEGAGGEEDGRPRSERVGVEEARPICPVSRPAASFTGPPSRDPAGRAGGDSLRAARGPSGHAGGDR